MSRRRRHQRVPRRVVLQPRDVEIQTDLLHFRFLSTDQIRRLHPELRIRSKKTTQQRLRELYDAGYIDRLAVPQVPGYPAPPCIYYLKKRGYEAVSEASDHLELEKILTRFPVQSNGTVPLDLHHTIALSEFHLQVVVALEDHPILRLSWWMSDFEVGHPKRRGINPRKAVYRHLGRRGFVPDAVFVVQGRGERLSRHHRLFFVEVDRGTKWGARMRSQIAAYDFARRKNLADTYHQGVGGHRVLIPTTSKRRINFILSKGNQSPGLDLCLFTTFSELSPETVFNESIWQMWNGREIATTSIVRKENE